MFSRAPYCRRRVLTFSHSVKFDTSKSMALSVPGGFSADDVQERQRASLAALSQGLPSQSSGTMISRRSCPCSRASRRVATLTRARPRPWPGTAPVAALSMVAFATIMLMERTPRSEAPSGRRRRPEPKSTCPCRTAHLGVLRRTQNHRLAVYRRRPVGAPRRAFSRTRAAQARRVRQLHRSAAHPKDPLYEAVGQKLGDKGMSQRLDDKAQATKHACVARIRLCHHSDCRSQRGLWR